MFHPSGQQEKQDKALAASQTDAGKLPPKIPPPIFQPAEYTVESIKWFGRGRCLAQEQGTGFTAPVAGLLPNERARVIIQDGMLRNARIVAIERPAEGRVAPPCTQAGICPGCTMQHVSRSGRAHYAATLVSEVLEKFAGFSCPPDTVDVVMGPDGDHRTRTKLLLRRGETTEVGMRRGRDSREPLVDFRACWANAPALRRAAEVLANAVLAPALWPVEDDPLLSVELECVDDVLLVAGDDAAVVDAVHAALQMELPTLGVSAVRIVGEDRPWTHANAAMSDVLYASILDRLTVDGKTVFDLTCGDGGCTFAMAERGATVLASDRHWEAVQRTEAAAVARGITAVQTRGGDALAVLKGAAKRGENPDVVVINPMREPVGEETMTAVDATTATHVLYMAPAPKAGAKDLRVLHDAGWVLTYVAAVDLHPWTGQVMMVVIARRTEKICNGLFDNRKKSDKDGLSETVVSSESRAQGP